MDAQSSPAPLLPGGMLTALGARTAEGREVEFAVDAAPAAPFPVERHVGRRKVPLQGLQVVEVPVAGPYLAAGPRAIFMACPQADPALIIWADLLFADGDFLAALGRSNRRWFLNVLGRRSKRGSRVMVGYGRSRRFIGRQE